MTMGVLGNRHFFLFNCLKQIDENEPIDLSTLDKRVEFQKKVYLLQSLGVPLNYSFGSYIKGPYSRSLAEVGFTIYESPPGSIPNNIDKITPIDEKSLNKINKLKKLIDDLPKNKKKSYWLELISSLHLLCTKAYPKAKNWEEAENRLKIWKPLKFTNKDIKIAIKLIEKNDLING